MARHRLSGLLRFIRLFKGAGLLATALTLSSPGMAGALELLLGTGEAGSFSHHAGRAVCRTINRNAGDLQCKTAPSSDPFDTLTNLQGGSLDMALVDSRLLHDAATKSGVFRFLDIGYENLRSLFPLYEVPAVLVARRDAGIASAGDLAGRRINAGAPGTPRRTATEALMSAKNWTKDDFNLFGELSASQNQDTMAFCHGTFEALILPGVHPDPSLRKLLELCEAVLVNMHDKDIERFIEEQPAFHKIVVPAGTYPSRATAVVTFGTRAVLTASGNLDSETAERIMEAIFGDLERLHGAHPAMKWLDKEKARDSAPGLPPHPAAVRYFSEP